MWTEKLKETGLCSEFPITLPTDSVDTRYERTECVLTVPSPLAFREAGVYGRAAGQDGIIPDVCEPPAEFHLCFTRGFREAHHDWEIWSNVGPTPF